MMALGSPLFLRKQARSLQLKLWISLAIFSFMLSSQLRVANAQLSVGGDATSVTDASAAAADVSSVVTSLTGSASTTLSVETSSASAAIGDASSAVGVNSITSSVGGIKGPTSILTSGVAQDTTDILSSAATGVDAAASGVTGSVGLATTGVIGAVETAASGATSAVGTATSGLQSGSVTGVVSGVSGAVDTATSGSAGVLGTATNGVTGSVGSATSGAVVGAVGSVAGAATGATDTASAPITNGVASSLSGGATITGDGSIVTTTGVTQQAICPGGCGEHGRCVDGQCECEYGYTGTDCTKSVSTYSAAVVVGGASIAAVGSAVAVSVAVSVAGGTGAVAGVGGAGGAVVGGIGGASSGGSSGVGSGTHYTGWAGTGLVLHLQTVASVAVLSVKSGTPFEEFSSQFSWSNFLLPWPWMTDKAVADTGRRLLGIRAMCEGANVHPSRLFVNNLFTIGLVLLGTYLLAMAVEAVLAWYLWKRPRGCDPHKIEQTRRRFRLVLGGWVLRLSVLIYFGVSLAVAWQLSQWYTDQMQASLFVLALSVAAVFLIGMPVALAFKVLRTPTSPDGKLKYGMLYSAVVGPFRKRRRWFFLIMFARRLLLAVALIALSARPKAQVIVVVCLLAAYAVALVVIRPFRLRALFVVESTAAILTAIVFGLAIAFIEDWFSLDKTTQEALSWLIIVLEIAIAALYVVLVCYIAAPAACASVRKLKAARHKAILESSSSLECSGSSENFTVSVGGDKRAEYTELESIAVPLDSTESNSPSPNEGAPIARQAGPS